jgi:hypothetical protein
MQAQPGKSAGYRSAGASILALAAVLLLVAGCRRAAGPAAPRDEPPPARSAVELGPLRLTVSVAPAKVRLSDEPTLTVRIEYQPGVKVRKPAFGQSITDFVIRDVHEPLPRVEGDREIIEQVYTLEPTRTGKIFIFPIGVTFTDARPNGDGKEHTLESEGVTVEVASAADGQAPSLAALRGPAAPVELPAPAGHGGWWIALAAAVVAAAIAILVWHSRRRRRAAAEKALSPAELAYLELQRLLEARLAETDVKLFYVELTGVVRRYIERTTGIRAPEQTTQEFLGQLSRGLALFAVPEQQRLQDFLESADLVKFAAHHPRAEDVQESFQRAKIFIGLEQREVAA